jgi:two-component system OmpR family sensor kinase
VTLRRRFLLYFVAFSVVLTIAGGWLAWTVATRALNEELDEKLTSVAGAAARVGFDPVILASLQPGDEGARFYRSNLERLRQLQRYVSAAYFFRRDSIGSDHRVLVSTLGPDSLPIGRPLRFLAAYPDEIQEAWEQGESTSPLFDVDGRQYKYGFVRLEGSGRSADVMLAVQIAANYTAALDRFRRSLVLGSVGAALVASLLAYILARNVIWPVSELSRAALRIQRGRLDEPIVGTHREDELGQLARAMDRMRLGVEERDRQLRLMLAQVAHEIRNPLGGMELMAAVAAESADPIERNRLLGRVREEVTALNEIITDFLAYAKPMHPQTRRHDVRAPIRAAAEIVAAEAAARGRTVAVDLPDTELMVDADPDQMKQVFLNLIRNGAQAGEQVWVEGRQENGQVAIVVRDNGPGVNPDLRNRIFHPFVTDKEQGAGLGLAIVSMIVDANSAHLEVEEGGEIAGKGAEFSVYFGDSDPSARPE